jgi:hypothetical protein
LIFYVVSKKLWSFCFICVYINTDKLPWLAAWSSGEVSACHIGDWSYVRVARSNPARVQGVSLRKRWLLFQIATFPF